MQNFKQNRYVRRLLQLISSSLLFPPLVVLVAILVITIWPWQNAKQNLNTDINRSINDQIIAVEENLNTQFSNYSTILQSGIGLLKTNVALNKDQWQTYFTATDLTTERTGIQGITYIKVFDQTELSTLTQTMYNQGVLDFTIKPAEPARQRYSAVLYVYPETENTRAVIGLDMLTIPARKKTMEKAIELGRPILSEKVKLIQNVPTDDQYGFLLYAPYFKPGATVSDPKQRSENIDGFVAAGFRSKRFFNKLLDASAHDSNYSVQVYDGTISDSTLLYRTKNTDMIAKKRVIRSVTRPMTVHDRTWQFVFTFDTGRVASSSEKNAPTYILLVGVITAFLVFLALLSIFRSRARELQQQKDIEVNLAKDELLSLASHQMRTPATGVKQYLGMVLQGFAGDIDESQKTLLDKAYTSNERQLHVINQILHLAKLESGRIVLAKHTTNLNELVRDIAEEQNDDVLARGHTMKLHIPKKHIVQKVDSHMMRMAIENILSNAIKYTTEPGKITVKLSQTVNHIMISVKDSGIGIDQKEFPKIFKQFTRLYDEQTERISGTGVGLYLADQLVKLHKGSLTVQSKVGEGSEFIITLPKSVNKKQ